MKTNIPNLLKEQREGELFEMLTEAHGITPKEANCIIKNSLSPYTNDLIKAVVSEVEKMAEKTWREDMECSGGHRMSTQRFLDRLESLINDIEK